MNYTSSQVKKYAELLSFTATSELTLAFSDQGATDENLALGVFHREVAILASVMDLQLDDIELTYLNLRDYMIDQLFKGAASTVDIERNLDTVLPILIRKTLMEKDMVPTALGKSLVEQKIVAMFSEDQASDVHN